MRIVKNRLSAAETLDVLNKQWLDTSDIQLILSVGQTKARSIKNDIRKDLIENKYYLPNNLIPTEALVKYAHISIEFLKKNK